MEFKLSGFKLSPLIAGFLLLNSTPVFAWGERGHDIVTRVAVQNLVAISQQNIAVTRPFTLRDHMLSHLSNVPDIVWRSDAMTDAELASNVPTHYINLERAYDKVANLSDLDLDYKAYANRVAEREMENKNDTGTAPWRILQLYKGMVASFRAVSSASNREQKLAAINDALLHGGLMSHFVGDLANPHHSTVDHDGKATGNAGLHAYFESDIVMALPFKLITQVNAKAGKRLLDRTIFKDISKSQQHIALTDPESLVFSLLVNSHNNLRRLTQLDNKYSLLRASVNDGTQALRKPPGEISKHYRRFIVERLAIGASVLSQLWLSAWIEAGKPDMSSFHSYYYPVSPAYIWPDYIDN